MPEEQFKRIFSTKGERQDLENCQFAVQGLDGKLAGIILKSDASVMHLGRVRAYKNNSFVFTLHKDNGDGLGVFNYENVAQVWY